MRPCQPRRQPWLAMASDDPSFAEFREAIFLALGCGDRVRGFLFGFSRPKVLDAGHAITSCAILWLPEQANG